MNESQMLQKLIDNGWTRAQFRQIDANDVLPDGKKLEHWMISGIKTVGDVAVRKNFLLYKYSDGAYTWQEHDPFPAPKPPPQFQLDLAAYLKGVEDKILLATATQVSLEKEKAVLTGVLDVSGMLFEKKALIFRGTDGKLTHKIIEE